MENTKKGKNQTQFQRVVNNTIIGLIVPFISQPFEVIRTSSIISLIKRKREATTHTSNVNFRGMAGTISDIYKTEGFQGFYRGGSWALIKGAIGYVFFFTGLENIRSYSNKLFNTEKNQYGRTTMFLINFMNSGVARILTTILLNPIVIMKTRFEVSGSDNSSLTRAVSTFYKQNGARGFFVGVIPSLMKDVPYSGLQYSFYREILSLLDYDKKKQDAYSKVKISTAAFFSAVGAILITYPMDNIRVRFQCDDMNLGSQSLQHRRWNLLKEVYQTEGISGFYQGYLPRLVRKGFNAILCWILYETLQQNNYSY